MTLSTAPPYPKMPLAMNRTTSRTQNMLAIACCVLVVLAGCTSRDNTQKATLSQIRDEAIAYMREAIQATGAKIETASGQFSSCNDNGTDPFRAHIGVSPPPLPTEAKAMALIDAWVRSAIAAGWRIEPSTSATESNQTMLYTLDMTKGDIGFQINGPYPRQPITISIVSGTKCYRTGENDPRLDWSESSDELVAKLTAPTSPSAGVSPS